MTGCKYNICSALQDIDIPNSVTTIGWYAFRGCSALQSIDIPNSVTTIHEGAFSECSTLQSINIPNRVTTIEKYAFSGCLCLKEIHIHWTQIDNIQVDDYAFGNRINVEKCILYIPSGTRWTYRHHPVFGKFKNIVTDKQIEV
ncbi:MAG: leucine-rich repeat domain-containing protein [Bacteroides sp.]|nr:leucine-rich repeat domain-containing protein [Bacteroides sp.]